MGSRVISGSPVLDVILTFYLSVYDYKDLPFAGATVITESDNVASYSYDASIKELISFDIPAIVTIKSQYINSNGMAVSDVLNALLTNRT